MAEPTVEVTPRVLAGIADLESVVGTHLGYSTWHLIDQERVDMFAAATGDHQWIHTDPVRAAAGPYGSTIAHGFLTLSLLPMLQWEVYRIEGVVMEVNYGAERLRFPGPVPVGSRVRAGVELLSLEERPGAHQLISRVSIEREHVDKPVCVVEMVTRLQVRS